MKCKSRVAPGMIPWHSNLKTLSDCDLLYREPFDISSGAEVSEQQQLWDSCTAGEERSSTERMVTSDDTCTHTPTHTRAHNVQAQTKAFACDHMCTLTVLLLFSHLQMLDVQQHTYMILLQYNGYLILQHCLNNCPEPMNVLLRCVMSVLCSLDFQHLLSCQHRCVRLKPNNNQGGVMWFSIMS